jgi:nucleotide-binding universal stress UspA family protein
MSLMSICLPGKVLSSWFVKGELVAAMFEKILIATDGSERNQPAVKKGLELARKCGAMVYAIYVIDEVMIASAEAGVLTSDLYKTLKEEGDYTLEGIKRLAEGQRVETHVLSGRPAKVITDFAVKNNVDLIVVGSQGKTGFKRLVLGSVAESVLRMAECMVLVVKNKEEN